MKIKVTIAGSETLYQSTIERLLSKYPSIEVISKLTGLVGLSRDSTKWHITDIMLLDIDGRDRYNSDIVEEMLINRPELKVIVITKEDSKVNILSLCKLGIKSFLLKANPIEEIVIAIETVYQGGYFFPNEIGNLLLSSIRTTPPKKITISEFDLQVLKLTSKGLSCTRISKYLNRSPRTIEDHREKLYRLFEVVNKEQLLVAAVKSGII